MQASSHLLKNLQVLHIPKYYQKCIPFWNMLSRLLACSQFSCMFYPENIIYSNKIQELWYKEKISRGQMWYLNHLLENKQETVLQTVVIKNRISDKKKGSREGEMFSTLNM